MARLFDIAARHAARLARGRTSWLFVLIAVLAAMTTVLLGLDTTAVLLTPVVLSVAVQLDLPPLPFALLTVWLANTASLLLPVSNLTNLLALDRLNVEPHQFAARMWAPELVAVALTVLLIGARYRRLLTVRYAPLPAPHVDDPLLLTAAAAACLGIVPALLLGADPVTTMTVAAASLTGVFAVRNRSVLRLRLVPWRLAVLVLSLALVVETALRHGGGRVVRAVVGSGGGLGDLLQVAGVGAAASNLVNNLPAYLVIEPHVVPDGGASVASGSASASGGDPRLFALLLGTNLGPLVLLWGSLATLLWRERLRARGLDVSARQFATFGLIGVPVILTCAAVALWLTG